MRGIRHTDCKPLAKWDLSSAQVLVIFATRRNYQVGQGHPWGSYQGGVECAYTERRPEETRYEREAGTL